MTGLDLECCGACKEVGKIGSGWLWLPALGLHLLQTSSRRQHHHTSAPMTPTYRHITYSEVPKKARKRYRVRKARKATGT